MSGLWDHDLANQTKHLACGPSGFWDHLFSNIVSICIYLMCILFPTPDLRSVSNRAGGYHSRNLEARPQPGDDKQTSVIIREKDRPFQFKIPWFIVDERPSFVPNFNS